MVGSLASSTSRGAKVFEFILEHAATVAICVGGGVLIGSGAVLLCLAVHKVLMFFGEE